MRRASAKWLWAGLALTVAAIALGSFLAWHSYRTTRELATQELYMIELQGEITYLDEVLSMSARMAATTGQISWEDRFRAAEGKLASVLDDMLALAPTTAIAMLSLQADVMNDELVVMDNTAFALVREGRLHEAKDLLFGGEYDAHKQIYAESINAMILSVNASIRAALDEHGDHVLVQTLVTALLLVFAAAAWGRTAYQLRGRSKSLAHALVASRRDHDAIREAHDELETMHKELVAKEKLSSLGLLAAGVAHEINNPMAYVTMNVHALLEDMRDSQEQLPAAMRDYVDELLPSTLDGIARVNTIVRDLQQFARGDSNEKSDFDLNTEVSAAARISATQLKGRIKLDLFLGRLPMLHGKPRQLTQVMVNLIVNASHAIGERSNGAISITTKHERDHAIVAVTDNGCGMTPEVMEKVFQPFFTTKDVGRGTGLGLSVAFGIVHAHGGTIELASELGVGTTFTLKFPVASGLVAPSIPPYMPEGTPAAGTRIC